MHVYFIFLQNTNGPTVCDVRRSYNSVQLYNQSSNVALEERNKTTQLMSALILIELNSD